MWIGKWTPGAPLLGLTNKRRRASAFLSLLLAATNESSGGYIGR
jgi:hypothetical protein